MSEEEKSKTKVVSPSKSRMNKETRRKRQRELKSRVAPGKNVKGEIGYAALARIENASEKMKYVGLDVENMAVWQKAAYDAATWFGITSTSKRLGKERKGIDRYMAGLENLVGQCDEDLYHDSKGLYTRVADIQTQLDEAIELRSLCDDEMTDLTLEMTALRGDYKNKLANPSSSTKSSADIVHALRSAEQFYEHNEDTLEDANYSIETAYVQRQGIAEDIADVRTIRRQTKDLVYETRLILLEYSSEVKLGEMVSGLSELVKGNVEPIAKHREHLAELRDARGDLRKTLGDLPKPGTRTKYMQKPSPYRHEANEESRQLADDRNARADEIIELVMNEPLLI